MSDIIAQYRNNPAVEETEKLLPRQEKKEPIPAKLSLSIDVSRRTGRPPNWVDFEDGDPGCKRACSHCIFNTRPWVTWVSTLCITICIRFLVDVYYVYDNTVILGFGLLALIIFVIIYMVSVVRSETWKKVSRTMSRRQLEDRLEVLYRSAPKIIWHLQCYHNDDSQADVTYSDGSACVEMTKKKIITWYGTKTFDFKSWKDVTHPFQLAESGSYQIISMHKKYMFADEETRAAYESQKKAFVEEHQQRDQLYCIEEVFELDGFQESMLAEISGCPCTASQIVYALMMLLLLAYPWSFLVKKGERRLDYHCVKTVSVSHEKISIVQVALPQPQLAVSTAKMEDPKHSRMDGEKMPKEYRTESSWNHFLPSTS